MSDAVAGEAAATAPSGDPVIELAGVEHRYPDGQLALRGIDLRIDKGERVAVLGPNGSGKTTLVLHLNGVLFPTSGSVRILGTGVGADTSRSQLQEVRRGVGVVFQDPDDQLFMPTVRQDVAFGPANLGLRGDDLAQRVTAALEEVGMVDALDRAPHHLSFGQRRRVALATVLAMDPSILVLDEPSANLDPLARRQLAEILLASDLTTVVVTHDLLYALQLCERSVIVDAGRVVADGPTAELLADTELLAAHRLELPPGISLAPTVGSQPPAGHRS